MDKYTDVELGLLLNRAYQTLASAQNDIAIINQELNRRAQPKVEKKK